MKWFATVLGAVLLLLQYRLWMSNDGVREVLRLRSAVISQQVDNVRLSERNLQLSAEVRDLKQGFVALEERARTDLGMIASNETFFQVVPAEAQGLASPPAQAVPAAAAQPLAHTAAR